MYLSDKEKGACGFSSLDLISSSIIVMTVRAQAVLQNLPYDWRKY